MSLLVSATGRPEGKHAEDIGVQPSYKQIIHTGLFGGTYDFTKKEQGNTQTSIDHSKYEVHEPEEYEKGTIAEHVYGEGGHGEHGKGKHYHGHYGSHAQREYAKENEKDENSGKVEYGIHGKGTYGQDDNGYKKESGIPGYGTHGSFDHHDTEEEYGYHNSGRKEENRGTGYYVTENHNEHNAKASSVYPSREGKREINKEMVDGDSRLADIISEIDEERKLQNKVPVNIRHFSTFESQSVDSHKSHETGGQKDEGLGAYASGKHDYKLQESSNIGGYKVHENQDYEDKMSAEKNEKGGLGEYASGKYEDVKHGMKSSSNIAEYGAQINQDRYDYKGGHINEGSMEKVENGGLGDYSLGIDDVRKHVHYRSDGGNDPKKYDSAFGEERKNDERRLEGGRKDYEVKEFEGYYR